jgi:hypothetical protein
VNEKAGCDSWIVAGFLLVAALRAKRVSLVSLVVAGMYTMAFGNYRLVSVATGVVALIAAAMTAPARAEESAQQAALAQQQRMRVLEARLQYLEEKLSKLEREAIETAQKRDQAGDKTKGNRKPKTNGAISGNIPASTAKREGNQQSGSVATDSPTSTSTATSQTPASSAAGAAGSVATDSSTSTSTATSQTPASSAAAAAKESNLQETFIFRDQAPTLKKGEAEVALDFNYIHSSGFLQIDRITTQAATIRYGLFDGLEIAGALPHYDSVVTTNIGPNLQYNGKADGIGSATLGLSYNLLSQTPDWPGLALSVTGIYPGQVDPYGSLITPGKIPIDILRSVQNTGHWGIGANLVAYKIVDPLLVFAGFGPTYLFPKTYAGYSVEPAIRYSANVGFSFALTEKTTLAFQTIALYQPDLKIAGIVSPQSYQEQYIGRGALTVRIFDKTWIEPSVAIGLTNESPAMALDLTFRKRW